MAPKNNHFKDEKKLILVTVQYMLENGLSDLTGGYRPAKNHYKNILLKFQDSIVSDEALANLYTKWKRNDKNFRTKVIDILTEKDETITTTNQDSNGFKIDFSGAEWKKLSQFISLGLRKKFNAAANETFLNKIRLNGFECSFKLKTNYFSTAKKNIVGNKFWSGVFKCECCHKDVRAYIRNKPTENSDVKLTLLAENKECVDSGKPIKRRIRFCGAERQNLMNEIFSKGVANFRNEAFAFGNTEKQDISYENIRKMSSQHRHRHQLSHDLRLDADSAKNVFDQMLPGKGFKSIKGYIQEIQSNPFGVLLISDIQAKIWGLIKETDPVWYFDATGSIMAKCPNQKETLLYSLIANDSKNKTSISVADFLSSANDTITINCYLTKIIQRYGLYFFFEKPRVVVTDFSWANLHALSKAFNNLEIIDYLNLIFQILVEKKKYALAPIKTLVYLCSTHFLKNIIEETNDVLKYCDQDQRVIIKRKFIKSFILLQNSVCFEEFCLILKSIKIIFTRKHKDEIFVESLAKLEIFNSSFNTDWIKEIKFVSKKNVSYGAESKIYFVENRNINFTHDSPFTKYFDDLLIDQKDDNSQIMNLNNNNLYFPNLFNIIKKKLHLVPLWSGIMLKIVGLDRTRLSNNFVEGWFSYFKTKILKINKSVRNCRKLYTNELATPLYFEIQRKYSTFYEDRFNIRYDNLEKKKDFYIGDKISTEKYSYKKPIKSIADYYNSKFSFLNNEEENIRDKVKSKNARDLNLSKYFDDNIFQGDDFDSFEHKKDSNFEMSEYCDEQMAVDENSLECNEKMEIVSDILIGTEDVFEKYGIEKNDLYYYKVEKVLINKRELANLLNGNWLSDTILEACARVFAKISKKIGLFLTSYKCNQLSEQGNITNDRFFKLENQTYVSGFYFQNNNHWCLIYIDLKQNSFYYIDPLGEDEIKSKFIFNNWNQYFTRKFNRKLIRRNKEHTFQKDSNNCGLFVCLFFKLFLEDKDLNLENSKSNLEKKRISLSYSFKQYSKKTFCSFCGSDLEIDDKIVKKDCEHRFHEICTEHRSGITLNLSKQNFICPLCF